MTIVAWRGTGCHHYLHPFSIQGTNLKLNKWEKLLSLAGLLLLPLGILPGVVAFYSISDCLKHRKFKKINRSLPITDVINENALRKTISVSGSISSSSSASVSQPTVPDANAASLEIHFLDAQNNTLHQTKISHQILAKIPYFERLLQSGMKENTSQKIDLHDIDPKLFSALIDFVQASTLQISVANCCALHKMAGFFGCDEMQKRCLDWMLKNISEKNFQELLAFADDQVLDNLKRACGDWILAHVKDFDIRDLHALISRYQLTSNALIHAFLAHSFSQGADKRDFRPVLAHLEKLDLRQFWQITTEELGQILRTCPHVTELIAHAEIDNGDLRTIVKSLPNLGILDLRNCYNYWSLNLSILSTLPKLRVLRLNYLDKGSTLSGLTNLRVLEIDGLCGNDVNFLKNLKHLETLKILTNSKNPPSINHLVNLKSLTFKHFGPPIFDFSRLSKLEKLSLYQLNSFDDLTNLTNLQKLRVGFTNDSNLSALAKLPKLQKFHLPTIFMVSLLHLNLPNLIKLNLHAISNLSNLNLFTNLQELVLTNCQLDKFAMPPDLKKLKLILCTASGLPDDLKKLKHLTIIDTTLSKNFSLASLQNLKFLHFQPRLPRVDLKTFKTVQILPRVDLNTLPSPSIQTLVLKSCTIDDLTPLKNATSLQRLHLIDCTISDYRPLASLKNLKALSLAGCNIQDLSVLSALDKLEFLDLSRCPNVTTLDALTGLPQLKELNLVNTNQKGKLILEPLLNLPNLTNIQMNAASGLKWNLRAVT